MVSQCCSMTVTDVSPTGTEIPQIGNPNGQLPPPPNQFSVPPPIIYQPNFENVPQYRPPVAVPPTAQTQSDADQPSMPPSDQNPISDSFQTKSDGPGEFEKDKSSSPHDSGCESDCATGGRNSETTNDDGRLKSDNTDNARADYVDSKPNEVPKMDLENFPEIIDHTKEYSSKPKRKYYMYGHHKLIKPIRDIPPRFQMMLAETSAAKARCEGQPIIIPNPVCHNDDFPPDAYGNGFNPDAKCFVPGNLSPPDNNVMNGEFGGPVEKECSCNGPHNPGDGSCSCSLLYTVHVYGSNTASSPACSSNCNKNNGVGCSGCLTNTSTHSPFYAGGYGNTPCLTQGPTYYTNQPYPMATPVPYPPGASQYMCNGGQIPMVGPMPPPPPPQAIQAQAPPPQPLAPLPTKVAPMTTPPAPQQQPA